MTIPFMMRTVTDMTNRGLYTDPIGDALTDDVVKSPHDDGQCYIRSSIQKWFRQKKSHPLTRNSMQMSEMKELTQKTIPGRRNLVFYSESLVQQLVEDSEAGRIQSVKQLLKRGANPNQQSKKGNLPLVLAAQKGHT